VASKQTPPKSVRTLACAGNGMGWDGMGWDGMGAATVTQRALTRGWGEQVLPSTIRPGAWVGQRRTFVGLHILIDYERLAIADRCILGTCTPHLHSRLHAAIHVRSGGSAVHASHHSLGRATACSVTAWSTLPQ
jgi:hypothetical protein